jgi:hypothetical protein
MKSVTEDNQVSQKKKEEKPKHNRVPSIKSTTDDNQTNQISKNDKYKRDI